MISNSVFFLTRAMTEGLCLQGRQLRIAPKLEDDPFYYTYRDALNAFENRIANDPAYLDSLLTAEQHQERSGLLNGLNIRSSNVITNVQRRLRQYELHAIPKSTYNPIVQRDLAKECNNSNNSFFLSPRQQMVSYCRIFAYKLIQFFCRIINLAFHLKVTFTSVTRAVIQRTVVGVILLTIAKRTSMVVRIP